MRTTADAVTPSAPLFSPSGRGTRPGQLPLFYGLYGALRDEVPEKDMECHIEGPDGDPMEDFGISPRQGSASCSPQQREKEEYMEDVRRGVLGEAHVEEPRRSRLDFKEEMDVAAVGPHRDSGGNISRPCDRHSWSLSLQTPPCRKM